MMRKTKTLNAAEQNKIREEATVTLRRALAGRSFRPVLFLGPRATAQRAFLEDIALEAESLGFLVPRIDARDEYRWRAREGKEEDPEYDRQRMSSVPDAARRKDLRRHPRPLRRSGPKRPCGGKRPASCSERHGAPLPKGVGRPHRGTSPDDAIELNENASS